jgi:hypothetical protein
MIIAPQTVYSMAAALARAQSATRRVILRAAVMAGPGTREWTEAEEELASLERWDCVPVSR